MQFFFTVAWKQETISLFGKKMQNLQADSHFSGEPVTCCAK